MTTLRKFANRRQAGYHQSRINAISLLDKAASYLLATNYSRLRSATAVSQSLIQMDCVAVAVINGEWIIASNSKKLDDFDIEMLANELCEDITYALVKRGLGSMHAEMQVLEEIKASGYHTQDIYIGVSKPCCLDCKELLDGCGMKYLHYHQDKVINWERPQM